jgi:hypothetical protein
LQICDLLINLKICGFAICGLAYQEICGFAIEELTKELADLQFEELKKVCLPTAANLEDAGFLRPKSEVLHKKQCHTF